MEKYSHLTELQKLEILHFAMQEAQNGNTSELETALEIVEEMREPYLD